MQKAFVSNVHSVVSGILAKTTSQILEIFTTSITTESKFDTDVHKNPATHHFFCSSDDKPNVVNLSLFEAIVSSTFKLPSPL